MAEEAAEHVAGVGDAAVLEQKRLATAPAPRVAPVGPRRPVSISWPKRAHGQATVDPAAGRNVSSMVVLTQASLSGAQASDQGLDRSPGADERISKPSPRARGKAPTNVGRRPRNFDGNVAFPDRARRA
jgi:hypothetical protein